MIVNSLFLKYKESINFDSVLLSKADVASSNISSFESL